MIKIVDKSSFSVTEKQLIKYIEKHDADFPIPISKKVHISEYISKILKYGKYILAIDQDRIIGVLFYYDNDSTSKIAFASLLSVDASYRNKGIASKLFECFLNHVKDMNYVDLTTHITNEKAIKMYLKYGFKFIDEQRTDGTIILRKKLKDI